MDVDALLEKLGNTIREVFNVDVSDVRFLGEHRWDKVLICSEGKVEWIPDGVEFGHGANIWVVKNRRSLAIRDQSESKEFTQGRVARNFGIRGFLAAPLISKNGDVIGVIRALSKSPRDFTAQEIELFEQMVSGAAIAIENSRLYMDLTISNNAKSEFLGVMSHELRTPLNIIMGYANLIKDDLAGESAAPHRQSLQIIEHHANSLLDIINAIMDATRIESGNVAVDKQEVYITDLFEQLKSTCALPKDKDIALLWELPDDLPNITSDYEKLRRILRNLIDNAIKFTQTGTITVSARLVEHGAALYLMKREANPVNQEAQNHGRPVPSVTYQVPDDTAVESKPGTWHVTPDTEDKIRDTRVIEFSVQDTGIGIAEQTLPFIFEIFRQGDSSNTRAYEGAGLGLYVAKKYSELLGANISVESSVGQGSTFTVAVPINKP
jgi:signal transduction histidine kinase